ncbi:MAG: class I SAM-dependent methyltransferase [Oscillospiraceae bacterium]|nr:class I SAM-dependent methyltransferase [Oscillospiraceae bacterium]
MRQAAPVLDARLTLLLGMVGDAKRVADIGADHGRLCCALLHADVSRRVLAADISAPSLAKARRLLNAEGLADRAVFRVADGLRALDGAFEPLGADAVVLAGMGAKTMRGILSAGADHLGAARLILQPNLDAPQLRAWLAEGGFVLEDEALVRAHGRFYTALAARRGRGQSFTPKQCALGPLLLQRRPAVFAAWLAWRRDVLQGVLRGLDAARGARSAVKVRAVAQELAWVDAAQKGEEA